MPHVDPEQRRAYHRAYRAARAATDPGFAERLREYTRRHRARRRADPAWLEGQRRAAAQRRQDPQVRRAQADAARRWWAAHGQARNARRRARYRDDPAYVRRSRERMRRVRLRAPGTWPRGEAERAWDAALARHDAALRSYRADPILGKRYHRDRAAAALAEAQFDLIAETARWAATALRAMREGQPLPW